MRWGCENEYLVVVVDTAHERGKEDEALEQVLIPVEIPNLKKQN